MVIVASSAGGGHSADGGSCYSGVAGRRGHMGESRLRVRHLQQQEGGPDAGRGHDASAPEAHAPEPCDIYQTLRRDLE